MDGLLKILDMLGRTIAQMEQTIAQQQQAIEALTKQLTATPPEPLPSGEQQTQSP